EARIGPVASVDERFAWDEGEGDRTRDSWLLVHDEFFSRSCERLDITYSEDLEAVFTRFAVVWPPEHADA
ncbi:MAG: ASCH domain-containing protein, partial [Ornithinibacter sp.]